MQLIRLPVQKSYDFTIERTIHDLLVCTHFNLKLSRYFNFAITVRFIPFEYKEQEQEQEEEHQHLVVKIIIITTTSTTSTTLLHHFNSTLIIDDRFYLVFAYYFKSTMAFVNFITISAFTMVIIVVIIAPIAFTTQ